MESLCVAPCENDIHVGFKTWLHNDRLRFDLCLPKGDYLRLDYGGAHKPRLCPCH